ncbi:MAG: type II secretion system F family protein [Alsobacter sp.]
MDGLPILLFSTAVFVSIAVISFLAIQTYMARAQIRSRARDGMLTAMMLGVASSSVRLTKLAGLNDGLFRGRSADTSDLKLDLQVAGFYQENAIQVFSGLRLISLLSVPVIGIILALIFLPNATPIQLLLAAVILIVIGFMLPRAVLDRLKANAVVENRQIFPDLLDMLVVCMEAGLAFEASLQRLAQDFGLRSKRMGHILQAMSSELRAGRSTPDALDALAARLGLEEAKTLATLLKQSLELGSDVAGALQVYGAEMRDKRVAAAEEKANRLPVLMVIPLGVLIFPVILIVIMYPSIIRIMDTLKNFSGG